MSKCENSFTVKYHWCFKIKEMQHIHIEERWMSNKHKFEIVWCIEEHTLLSVDPINHLTRSMILFGSDWRSGIDKSGCFSIAFLLISKHCYKSCCKVGSVYN